MTSMKVIILATLLVLGFNNIVSSKGVLPEYYPSFFQNDGILQDIEDGGNTLIINATAYKIGRNMPVHTLESEFGSKNSLRKEMEVGFTLLDPKAKRKVITEIWVLPKGTVEQD